MSVWRRSLETTTTLWLVVGITGDFCYFSLLSSIILLFLFSPVYYSTPPVHFITPTKNRSHSTARSGWITRQLGLVIIRLPSQYSLQLSRLMSDVTQHVYLRRRMGACRVAAFVCPITMGCSCRNRRYICSQSCYRKTDSAIGFSASNRSTHVSGRGSNYSWGFLYCRGKKTRKLVTSPFISPSPGAIHGNR